MTEFIENRTEEELANAMLEAEVAQALVDQVIHSLGDFIEAWGAAMYMAGPSMHIHPYTYVPIIQYDSVIIIEEVAPEAP